MLRRLLAAVCCVVLVSPVWGDTWTDITGQYRTEAEFVSLENGVVQLRLTNGMTVDVPIQKLARKDREKAKQLAAKLRAPSNPAPTDPVPTNPNPDKQPPAADNAAKELLSQLEVKAKPQWGQRGRLDREGNKLPPILHLGIEVTGKPAEEATYFGQVAMSQAVADGKELQRKMAFFAEDDISRAFEKVDRNAIFAKHPDNGVLVRVNYENPGDVKLATYRGVLKLKTGGKTSLVSLGDLGKASGELIMNPELEAAGITCQLSALESAVSMTLKGNLPSIQSILVANQKGEKHERYTGGGNGGDDEDRQFRFDFRDGIPEDATINLTLRTDTIDVDVPFDFQDVKIAASRR